MAKEESLIQLETVERLILLIRGEKVILDADLARLYGVTTRALNQAVKRNIKRFPEDFMFQLLAEEVEAMRSQIVTASKRNVRFLPYVFTEHGAIMAANILNSEKAVSASVQVVREWKRAKTSRLTNTKPLKKRCTATSGTRKNISIGCMKISRRFVR